MAVLSKGDKVRLIKPEARDNSPTPDQPYTVTEVTTDMGRVWVQFDKYENTDDDRYYHRVRATDVVREGSEHLKYRNRLGTASGDTHLEHALDNDTDNDDTEE